MPVHSVAFTHRPPAAVPAQHLSTTEAVSAAFATLAASLETLIPEGPDKTYMMRHLRETAMWATTAVTRNPDGSPRSAA